MISAFGIPIRILHIPPASLHTWFAYAHIHHGISINYYPLGLSCLVGPCTFSSCFAFHVMQLGYIESQAAVS